MLGLFIIAAILLGLVATAGYAVLTFNEAASSTEQQRQNNAQMDMAATAVRMNLRAIQLDGVAFAPMGELGPEGWTTLPAWLGVNNRTPWGVSYLYCPYAPSPTLTAGAGAEQVIEGDGVTSYTVNLLNNAVTAGRDYVSESEAPSVSGVLALLISPKKNGTTPPNCRDVTYAGGRYTVPNGKVIAITGAQGVAERLAATTSQVDLYVSPTGSGSGATPSDPSSFDAAMAVWQAIKPPYATLHLVSGAYTITGASIDLSAQKPEEGVQRLLRIVGAGKTTTGITPAAPTIFSLPGTTLSLEALTLGTGMHLQATDGGLFLRDVATPQISLNRSQLTLSGAVDVVAPASAAYGLAATNSVISIGDASLSIDAGAATNGALSLRAAELRADGSTLTLDTADTHLCLDAASRSEVVLLGATINCSAPTGDRVGTGIAIDRTSRLASNGTWIVGNNQPAVMLSVQGVADLQGGSITLPLSADTGFEVSGGGELSISGGLILASPGTRPLQAVDARGAGGLDGSGATLHGADCWLGDLLSRSDDSNGGSSAPSAAATPDAISLMNRSDWTCRR